MPQVISLASARSRRASVSESAAPRRPSDLRLGELLLASGALSPETLSQALAERARMEIRLADLLIAEGLVPPDEIDATLCRLHDTGRADFTSYSPDPRLIDLLGPARCLRDGLLPWRRVGGATLIASSRPERFEELRADLPAGLQPAVMVICRETELQEALAACRAPALARAAETRVNDWDSCRFWYHAGPRAAVVLGLSGLGLATLAAPLAVLMLLTLWTMLWMTLGSGLKLAAAVAQLRALHRARRKPPDPPPTIARLPAVSILVPLHRETELAPRLIARLARLDYPRALLDICLVTEADDLDTRAMLDAVRLPPWMRALTVPAGQIKTKPRALNYALEFCRGSIIGIYDAEDAPAPDQLRRVVAHFHSCAPEVACLQGVLDFYNARANWLARCFAAEYAAWFRVVLPGLARIGLPVPLGGTTLFFRRPALEALGGWDAHNVTEDADLGIRLARHGYRTEFLDSVTEEEANCSAWPWVRQRSRWLKGYAMTWTTHSRRPGLLLRQLGPWATLGMQVLFLGSLTQFVFAPLLWSFWLLPLGLPHPLAASLGPAGLWLVFKLFLACEALNLAVGAVGLWRAGKPGLIALLPSLHVYFPLASLGSYKALWEMATRPFYWDKTRHGLGERDAAPRTTENRTAGKPASGSPAGKGVAEARNAGPDAQPSASIASAS
ncbi:Family 2 glycosyl transferase [Rhodovulum sulfidophilum]|uniref:Family 2 glycosyl transferase n=1 Tax=Rhodovulum sulfidophilum TaxID=35806 RepID=A0A0D6B0F2_RHOSU|nr:Family 2 glycosyl transferase [Rhodovulum sulfidophilum]